MANIALEWSSAALLYQKLRLKGTQWVKRR